MDRRGDNHVYAVRTPSQGKGRTDTYFIRFTKEDFMLLVEYFELDAVQYRFRCRHPSRGHFALALLLTRLSYPHRFRELQAVFGRGESYLKIYFLDTLEYLYERYQELIHWHPLLTYSRMEAYVKALNRCHGVDNIWGFIDGTFRPFCRPGSNQQMMYSGYKKLHGFKVQGIATPDGLLLAVDGPFEGKVNDLTMVRKSGLEARLKQVYTLSLTELVHLWLTIIL